MKHIYDILPEGYSDRKRKFLEYVLHRAHFWEIIWYLSEQEFFIIEDCLPLTLLNILSRIEFLYPEMFLLVLIITNYNIIIFM